MGNKCVCLCSVMSKPLQPWTIASWAPLSMEFSRQEYWNRLPFSIPEALPDPEIKPEWNKNLQQRDWALPEESEKSWMRRLVGGVEGEEGERYFRHPDPAQTKGLRQEEMHPVKKQTTLRDISRNEPEYTGPQRPYGCLVAKSFATPWTVVRQAPLSMGVPRQEYWRGLPSLPPGDLPNPEIKPESPALQVASLPLSHLGSRDHIKGLVLKSL